MQLRRPFLATIFVMVSAPMILVGIITQLAWTSYKVGRIMVDKFIEWL